MKNQKVAPARVVIGGLAGLIVFSVDAVATLIRFVLNPAIAERATAGAVFATVVFLFVFVAAGALAGYLWMVRVKILRFVCIGALVGATVWAYLTATWALTARPTAIAPPHASVLDAASIGAVGGALGGLLLFVIAGVRRMFENRG